MRMGTGKRTSETAKPEKALRQDKPAVELFHRIYDPDALAGAIRSLVGDPTSPDDHPTDDITPEDRNRLKCLRHIAADPRGPRRRSILGSPAMVERIQALSASMPHMAPAIDLVARAALASARTSTPLSVPPLLLLGDPGCGKSYTGRRLAEAIGGRDFDQTAFAFIACNSLDSFRIRGQNVAWRGAQMGRIAEILLASSSTPIVLLDEFDKASAAGSFEKPYDIWHSILDGVNSNHFRDDFLEIELRAGSIIFLASANDISALPRSIIDRFIIIDIPQPNREQLRLIITSLYAACREEYGGVLPSQLSSDALDELSRYSLRRIGQVLRLAVGYAAADGRLRLDVGDIRAAEALADSARLPGLGKRMGFVPVGGGF